MALLTAVLLIAALARFAALDALPPGWRDDELIEVDMDSRIAAGWRPLYIEEAEGHEPLYHYLHALTIGLFGPSRSSYRWLSAASGLLAVALTMALGRRWFGWQVAFLAGLAMASSFWPLMYSRIGLRHIGVLPPLLLAVGMLPVTRYTSNVERATFSVRSIVCGVALAACLYTYFAGRMAPFILLAFAVYLALFHRQVFKRQWKGLLVAGGVALVLFAPLGWYLAGRPVETRLEVVGKPLLELRQGNPSLAIETAAGTLGMFTFRGDPEWLYNVAGRPVFDWLTGAFFYLGVALAAWRWRRIEYGWLVIWLAGGIAPAMLSLPAGSLGHTIAALPAVYLLSGVGLATAASCLTNLIRPPSFIGGRWSVVGGHPSVVGGHPSVVGGHPSVVGGRRSVVSSRWSLLIVLLIPLLHGALSLRDYRRWADASFVRFLYHADIADVARYLNEHPDVQEVAVATTSEELQLDERGLRLDLTRTLARPRLFDPRYALALPGGSPAYVALTTYPPPAPPIRAILQEYPLIATGPVVADGAAYRIYRVEPTRPLWSEGATVSFGAGKLTLRDWRVSPQEARAGQSIEILTVWQVGPTGNLPPVLKLFFHLVAPDGALIATGDRLSLLASSLQPGDVFVQMTGIALPAELPPGDYTLLTGVYESDTNRRWETSEPGHVARLATVRTQAR